MPRPASHTTEPDAPSGRDGHPLWTRVERLIDELRRRGADVSVTEVLDAARAVEHTDLGHRSDLECALRTTLVKSAHHQSTFDQVFDQLFPCRVSSAVAPGTTGDGAPDGAEAWSVPETANDLSLDIARAIESIDGPNHDLVEHLVSRYAGIDDGARTERYHLYRTLRAIDLAAILSAAIARARDEGVVLDRSALDAHVERLRSMVATEIRMRLAALDPVSDSDRLAPGRVADPFDIELARASASDLEHIRAAVRPLARQLAAQLRRRRRSRTSGRIDVRRTIRRSMPTGGVPVDVVLRRDRVRRPELFVLCDVSGSVADFSAFTLTLISALADEVTSTRTFAFVDAIDEIGSLLASATDVIEPWQLLQSGRVIGADGHSDYGTVLERFWNDYGRAALTGHSTVIIVGDARGNDRPAREEILSDISRRARRVYWLNPEPRAHWNTSDSSMTAYAEYCTGVYEVGTIGQLSTAVLEMF